MSDEVVRVPLKRPLSANQMAIAAVIADGWPIRECARLMGAEYETFKSAMEVVALKVPGNLQARSRIMAWYRGAPIEVLGPDVQPLRQQTLKGAYAIASLPRCGECGQLVAHGERLSAAGRHKRPT